MALSTYASYLIINKDLGKSLDKVASQATIKRESEYYQSKIGSITSVEEFMKDYRLYSYATKAYGLEDMTYARAFMKKVLESDLTDSSSFANTLTDTRYQKFAAAFNFAGATKMAQSAAQENSLMKAYEASFSAEQTAISTETKYYDTKIDAVTDIDGLVNDKRLTTYALKSFGIYNQYYSTTRIKDFLTSDLADTSSYAYTDFVAPRAAYVTENEGLELGLALVNEYSTVFTEHKANVTRLAETSLSAEDRAAIEAQQETYSARMTEIETELGVTGANGEARYTAVSNLGSAYSSIRSANLSEIARIDAWLSFKENFAFNTDGTIASGPTLQTAEQKAAVEDKYLRVSSTSPSYALYLSDKALYEKAIETATTVDELLADSRVVSYIKTAYDITVQMTSSLRDILTSDPDNDSSFAALMGYRDIPKLFNFNADGTVKTGMKAQSATEITYTSSSGASVTVNPFEDIASLYKENYLYAFDDEVDKVMENYRTRIDAVNSVSDLFKTNASYWEANTSSTAEYREKKALPELWQVALRANGLDPADFTQTKLKRILTSDLSDKRSYANTLKDERIVAFAKSFNFDSDATTKVPLQAQSEGAVTDLTSAYKKQMTRFLSGKELTAAAEKAEKEITYYKDTMSGIKTVDELLADKRLVAVMLQSRGIDPKEVTTKDLKAMFLSDLSDKKSYVNTLGDKKFAELVASFNFDAKGVLSEDPAIIGSVQQRGDVLETINRYVNQSMEEQEGAANEGVRLALYFLRAAPEMTTAYQFLSDDALTQFFTTTFSLSTYFSSMDVEKQADTVKKYVDLEKLSDEKYVQSLIQRFAALYDAANSTTTSAALTILTGG